MNIVQLENYRQKLLQLKLALLNENDPDAASIELHPMPLDTLSFHLQIKLQEKIKFKQAQLQAVEGALRRIDQDDFGFCYVCNQAISEARLNLDLTSTRCVSCEE